MLYPGSTPFLSVEPVGLKKSNSFRRTVSVFGVFHGGWVGGNERRVVQPSALFSSAPDDARGLENDFADTVEQMGLVSSRQGPLEKIFRKDACYGTLQVAPPFFLKLLTRGAFYGSVNKPNFEKEA